MNNGKDKITEPSHEWKNVLIYFTIPFFKLLLLSVTIFFLNRLIDVYLIGNKTYFLQKIFSYDVNVLSNTLSGLGEVVTAILGIEITAIAIVVQLAANKYSSNIMELFIDNKVNVYLIALFVITGTNTVLVINTLNEKFIPLFSIAITVMLIALSLLMVIPHFSYVFNFLRPNNFLSYVKNRTINLLNDISLKRLSYSIEVKEKINYNINFVGDIALNSVYQGDRAVPLLCLSVLKDILSEYSQRKNNMPKEWFELTGNEYLDPDFSNYSEFVMKKIHDKQTYLERKVFRLYELIYNNSKLTLRDVASGVLVYSKILAEVFIKNKDINALNTVFQYFNSYLRFAITARDPRSAFNAFEQYRMIAEKLLDSYPKEVEKISFYFKFYGQEANKYSVLFILETAAHDLCRINQIAYEKNVKNKLELLKLFLTLDEPLEQTSDENSQKEKSLIGVRIAQAKLAGFYIMKGDLEFAKIIFEDMQIEPISRINKIKETIFQTTDEEFWEITPRGVNFNYVEPEIKAALVQFFGWFEKNCDLSNI
jgi:hypothetical protein